MINVKKMTEAMQARMPMKSLMQLVSKSAIVFSASLLSAIFFFGLATSSAQSLGDLARQQRKRMNARTANSTHVFTNEDLAKPKILDAVEMAHDAAQPTNRPESADTLSAPTPVLVPALPTGLPPILADVFQDSAAPVWPAGTPLGDVARYYRQQKDWRQQKELRAAPPDDSIVAQSAPKAVAPMQQAGTRRLPMAPRQNAGKLAPEQPLQKPKKIIAERTPVVQDTIPQERVVRVNNGDSLWKLASRYLGDGNQWRLIASANPEIANPDRILAGQQIRLPGATNDASNGGKNDVAAYNQIRVQAGDSLWKLAKAQWGTGQAWTCIADSNPQIENSFKIFPGQALTLPASCSATI